MEESIKFRPHHFMCTLGFSGKGYSPDFVRNYRNISETLAQDEDSLIEVVEFMDDICAPCPNKLNDTICKTQDKIRHLDDSYKESLHLVYGEVISWKEAKLRINENISVKKFLQNCQLCSWQKYGVCQKSLEKLLSSDLSSVAEE